jgi:predicted TIM-barrel fold metal-dependent hydrolase
VPTYLQRLDEHVEDWAGGERLQRPPSEQFRAQCFTSTEGDEIGVPLYLNLYPDNLIFASDYPHADCTFPGSTKALLDDHELTDAQKRAVLRTNAIRWFDLPIPAEGQSAGRTSIQ